VLSVVALGLPTPEIQIAFAHAEAQVHVAADAAQFVRCAAERRPLFAFVDRTVEPLHAVEALLLLERGGLCALPVVILSAVDDPYEDVETGVFIVPPFDVAGLLRIIRSLRALKAGAATPV
jgi:DNA-binding response OmpR family regulator